MHEKHVIKSNKLQNGSSSTIEKENSYFIKNMKASGFGSAIVEFKD